MIRYRAVLSSPQIALRAAAQIVLAIYADCELVIRDKNRTSAQNARLHSMLTEVARQKEWHGQQLSVDDWKDLLVPAYMKATGEKLRFLPNLDGDGFQIMYRSTAKMGVKQLNELMDFIEAWGTQNGIIFSHAG